jgi:hypothetical protein
MRHGTHVRDHRAEHPTTIVVLRGRARVGLAAQELGPQHLLPLEQGTVYDMEAIEDCDLLLVVGR